MHGRGLWPSLRCETASCCLSSSQPVDFWQEDATAAPELLVMLLCNVTTTELGSKQLLQIGLGDLEGFHM